MTETWAWVPGEVGRYEVSSIGRVRSHCRREPLIRKPHIDSTGRISVRFSGKNHTIHRLMAAAFYGPSKDIVRHLDGNEKNNVLTNLKYGTYSENARDTVAHGNNRNANKTVCSKGHEFTPANTYMHLNCRHCRTCNAAYVAAAKRKKRDK